MSSRIAALPYRLRLTLRQFAASRGQTALMLCGVALGVAVVVAIDLANASAERAFVLSTQTVAGRATHRISGGERGVAVDLYTRLRRRGFSKSAPVIERLIVVGGRPLTLLGVDPFAEAPFREFGAGTAEGSDRLMAESGTVLLARSTADDLGAGIGDRLIATIDGIEHSLELAGIVTPTNQRKRHALSSIAIVDIATAQELVAHPDRVDRIDLILDEQQTKEVREMLAPGSRLDPLGAAAGPARAMIAAFQTNLQALSLLALIVGLFLIFNTMNFSVVRRRAGLGTLRSLGMTSTDVFTQICCEAACVGIVGTALGLTLGVWLGYGAIELVTGTINELFFPLTFREASLTPVSLAKGTALGIFATVLAALPGAAEAASAPPRRAFLRSGLEDTAARLVRRAAGIGLALIALGGLCLALPTGNLLVGFAGLFGVTLGAAFLAPLATGGLMRLLVRPAAAWGGSLGAAAPRDVVRSLSRTSTAVAALMLAISVAIGLRLMIGSFRNTVAIWLENTLTGDVYISAPSVGGTASTALLDRDVVAALEQRTEADSLALVRSATMTSDRGPVRVAASNRAGRQREELLRDVSGDPATLPARLATGAIMISEPLASRLGLGVGDQLQLDTSSGRSSSRIEAVYYDYASSQGTVMLDLEYYRRQTGDSSVTGAALSLLDASQAEQVALNIARDLAPIQALETRANHSLRADVFAVFDQAFRITSALVLLATVVAALGILSALLAVLLERRRDFGVLRAIGLSGRQAAWQIYAQTALLGTTAAMLAIPTGCAVAYLLVHVINKRAFGWTLQLSFTLEPFAAALALGAMAALAAAIVPARRIRNAAPGELLR